MEIISKKHSNGKSATLYNMTKGTNRKPLKEFDGDVMELENYIIYTDVNQEGEVITCVALREPDGTIWVTNGTTFLRDFQLIVAITQECGESLDAIRIVEGTSKKGRTYRTCEMVE